MKILALLILASSLTACYSEDITPWWEKHKVLKDRAEEFCEPKGGVYKWDLTVRGGKVLCYDLTKYDTFTKKAFGS